LRVANPPIPPFPKFERVKVVMPIDGDKLTLWPQKREKWWEKLLGFPFELRPLAKDYLWISCNGEHVQIEPHYLESTFDTFWVDVRGVVKAQALWGLFPFTLGKQKQLLMGVVATLAAVPKRLKKKDEALAPTIECIQRYLASLRERAVPETQPLPMSKLRTTASARVWEAKLRNWHPEARV
jgi:hypothetical protein